jgi:hypothetical protein
MHSCYTLPLCLFLVEAAALPTRKVLAADANARGPPNSTHVLSASLHMCCASRMVPSHPCPNAGCLSYTDWVESQQLQQHCFACQYPAVCGSIKVKGGDVSPCGRPVFIVAD